MGHNVQSQAGVSLSDLYDVKGGQAPIERLLTTDVPVVHEMGATIQSERFSQFIRSSSVTVAQNANVDILMTALPSGVTRVNGIIVTTDNSGRLLRMSAHLEDTDGTIPRAMPVWVWDDQLGAVNMRILGATVSVLVPNIAFTQLPNLITSAEQPQRVSNIACRGLSSGFGAGDVTVTLFAMLSFAAIGGIGSIGLPIPSW